MPRTGTRPLAVPAAWRSPCRPAAGQHRTTGQTALSGRQVPTFRARAKTTLAPPPRRTPPGQSTGTRQAHPGTQSIPGFDVNLILRHVISGSLALAFVIHTCRAHGATFPVTLTTAALDRSSSRWFAASACTAATEGHRANRPGSSISCTAPHSNLGLLHPASFNVRGTHETGWRTRGEGARCGPRPPRARCSSRSPSTATASSSTR